MCYYSVLLGREMQSSGFQSTALACCSARGNISRCHEIDRQANVNHCALAAKNDAICECNVFSTIRGLSGSSLLREV